MSEYNQKTWKDRVSAYPRRRTLTDEDGNEYVYTITRNEGTVTTSGDAFSAANMNDLEGRIAGAVDSKVDSEDVITDYDTVMETELIGTVPDNTVIAQLNENKFDKANLLTTYAEVTAVTEEGTAADCLVIQELISNFQDGCETIANAITEAGVDTATDATPDEMAENILLIPQLGSSDGSGDSDGSDSSVTQIVYTESAEPVDDGVNFFNSIGNCIASYSWEEFLALSDMPDLPVFVVPTEAVKMGFADIWPDMTADGWNWTMEGLKEIYNLRQSGRVDVGSCYKPSDGKTYLLLDHVAPSAMKINLIPTDADGVTIDWGDGETDSVSTGTTYTSTSHYYDTAGPLAVSIEGEFSGAVDATSTTYKNLISNGSYLKYALLGDNVTELADHSFSGMYALHGVWVPNGISLLKSYMFYYCYCLPGVTIPLTDDKEYIPLYFISSDPAMSYIIASESTNGVADTTETVVGINSCCIHNSGYLLDALSLYCTDADVNLSNTDIHRVYLYGQPKNVGFYMCYELQSIDGLYYAPDDTDSLSSYYRFIRCDSLQSLTNIVDIQGDIDLSACYGLDYDSAIRVLNALSSSVTGTLTLNYETYRQLSSDDLAIATDKGWAITYS